MKTLITLIALLLGATSVAFAGVRIDARSAESMSTWVAQYDRIDGSVRNPHDVKDAAKALGYVQGAVDYIASAHGLTCVSSFSVLELAARMRSDYDVNPNQGNAADYVALALRDFGCKVDSAESPQSNRGSR